MDIKMLPLCEAAYVIWKIRDSLIAILGMD